LGHPRPRDQRRGAAPVEVERIRQAQARDLQHVAEALGDEEAQSRTGALDQRVDRDGGAVDDDVDLARIDAVLGGQALEAVLDGQGEVRRGGRDLEPGHLAGGRVVEGEVGERATDVDAEPVAPHPVQSRPSAATYRARERRAPSAASRVFATSSAEWASDTYI